jgi:hypothetical protein
MLFYTARFLLQDKQVQIIASVFSRLLCEIVMAVLLKGFQVLKIKNSGLKMAQIMTGGQILLNLRFH